MTHEVHQGMDTGGKSNEKEENVLHQGPAIIETDEERSNHLLTYRPGNGAGKDYK